eukprot:70352-Chlamydomonas_euryale.AAC.1
MRASKAAAICGCLVFGDSPPSPRLAHPQPAAPPPPPILRAAAGFYCLRPAENGDRRAVGTFYVCPRRRVVALHSR